MDALRATFVYGEPRSENRHRMWDQEVLQPWMVCGDFNEAAWQFEHFSESRHTENQMKAFRDMMHDCGLVDLGFRGLPWTYNNKQSAERNVRVRLDRAIATTNWSHLFPGASVEHLVSPRSDHCPLLIKLTD
jgi:endonuclease/exonuclease/phosphatase family metal-dependent hydrolase